MTVRRVVKPKLLLDEGLPPRSAFPVLNSYCDVKHSKHDLKLPGISDYKVYETARSTHRLIVTFNVRDFKDLIAKDGPSVIGVSTNLSNHQIDKKLISLIKKLKQDAFNGLYFPITGETKRSRIVR